MEIDGEEESSEFVLVGGGQQGVRNADRPSVALMVQRTSIIQEWRLPALLSLLRE